MIPVYGLAIFLGAALLFLVQPLFTRLLLPLLGGAPNVWNTAQVFFQLTLLAGYAYAHLITTRLGVRRQALFHLGILLLPLLALPLNLTHAAPPPPDANPIPWLLLTMLTTVGPPFLVISATGPLLQRWFSATTHPRASDPYFLYAASNLGSLLALLAYPTLIETNLRLAAQTTAWTALYITLIALMIGAAFYLLRNPLPDGRGSGPLPDGRGSVFKEDTGTSRVEGGEGRRAEGAEAERVKERGPAQPEPPARAVSRLPIPHPRILRWIALAAIPSALTLATTTTLTTAIASAPLFWIIPLSIYLLTFILAFLPRPILPHSAFRIASPLMIALGVIVAAVPIGRPLWLVLPLNLLVLFVLAMTCHGELARDRPAPSHLTAFFFWISLGGALGSAFSALLAPIVFRSVIEYGITLVAAAFLLPARAASDTAPRKTDLALALAAALACVAALHLGRNGTLSSTAANALAFGVPVLIGMRASSRPIRLGLWFGALLVVGHQNQLLTRGVLFQDRSFFGALAVTEAEGLRSLHHGTTIHGVQSTSPEGHTEPLAYYFRDGPIGQVFLRGPIPQQARIAVVGLGVGALLSYAEPGQRWTLYEIDPKVAAIAAEPRYFTYLAGAKAPFAVVLGDARRSLSRTEERYSLIVLDAYSSDAVPVHLLSREAFEVYLQRLEEGGLIAAHISNQHLDLGPVAFGISEALGLVSREQNVAVSPSAMAQGKKSSRWVILARRREDLGALGDDPRWSAPSPGKRVIWTDDFSSLWSIWRGE